MSKIYKHQQSLETNYSLSQISIDFQTEFREGPSFNVLHIISQAFKVDGKITNISN